MSSPRAPRRPLTRRVALLSATLCALLALASVALARPARGPYTGTTSESIAITFKVSHNRKHVLNLSTEIGYNGKCGQGGGPGFKVTARSLTLKRNGTFSGTGTGAPPVSFVKAIKVQITGKIRGRTATGNIEESPATHCGPGTTHPSASPYQETFIAKAH